MAVVTVTTPVAANADRVFHAISDVEHLPDTVPAIVSVEFLGERRTGVGTRFRETRRMGNQTHRTELEIVAFDPDARTLRMVSRTPGTLWDTTLAVHPTGSGSELVLRMAAESAGWRRLLHVAMRGLYRRGLAAHVAAVKAWCER